MKPVLKIKYIIDGENMSDEEYSEQEDKFIILTEADIIDLIRDRADGFNRFTDSIVLLNYEKL